MTWTLDRPGSVASLSGAVIIVGLVISAVVDSATTRGLALGAALGVVNLLVGAHVTRRSFRGEPGAVLISIAAGFGARFVVLVGLLALFTFASGLGVSPAAFGFTFLAFVIVHFALESVFALRLQRQEAA